MAETRGDMKYSGVMRMPGGSYGRASLEGVITIEGDLDCNELKTEGVFTGTGKIQAGFAKFNGVAGVDRQLSGERLDVNGELKVGEGMAVKDVTAEGKMYVRGDVTAEKFDVEGEFKTDGMCNAEELRCKGAIRVGKTLNAGEVNVSMYGPCNARDIECGNITVRKGGSSPMGLLANIFLPLVYGKAHFTVETIEGDEINVEHTTAKTIRGGKVFIGEGCVVDVVEYRDSFESASSAIIKKSVKV